MKPFTTASVVIFTLVALTHFCRIVMGWEIVVAGSVMPMWASYLGMVVAGALAVMLWRESRWRGAGCRGQMVSAKEDSV